MNITTQTIKREVTHDGVCVARMRIDIPQTEDGGRFDEFYRETGLRLERWFETTVAAAAAEEYDASDDERKRWRYRPMMFRVSHSTTVKPNGKVTVELNSALKTSGGRTAVSRRITQWEPKLRRLSPTWSRRSSKTR